MAIRSRFSSFFKPDQGEISANGKAQAGQAADGGGEGGAQPEAVSQPGQDARLTEWAVRLESIERQVRDLDDRRLMLEERERELKGVELELESGRAEVRRQLEQIAGMNSEQARERLLSEVADSARRQAGLALRRIEEETKLEADRRARGILSVAMQRLASELSSETTTRLIQLPNDEMKGRVIGREGRNIRALENLTGVDIIIDETPSAVVISSFDGVRREVAGRTLETLVADGRITPARCEEAYEQALRGVDEEALDAAREALLAARVGDLHPELVRLLGRLRHRTSYGQNVLDHLVECANLAAMMAAEIGADTELVRRATLLHDLGKGVSHEVEGSHAAVGARLARRYGEPEAVVHAIEAHHGEIEPESVEAVLVQAADALSGARPGARGEALEEYVKRLSDLEQIAMRHRGVHKVFAMKAGREVRVMVDPGRVSDEEAGLIALETATAIESEMEYPGRIKVTVIRESRSTSFAS